MRHWTLRGGYDGARHAEFVMEGGHLEPFHPAEVVSIEDAVAAIEALRRGPTEGESDDSRRARYLFNDGVDAALRVLRDEGDGSHE